MGRRPAPPALLLVLALTGFPAHAATPSNETPIAPPIADLAVPFVASLDPEVAFTARTFSGSVSVTGDGVVVYTLPKRGELRERFVEASPSPTGGDASPTRVNLFLGNDPARWRTDLPSYARVELGEVWPGVAVELRARSRNVEKLFHIAPGVEPAVIRLRVSGASRLHVDGDGALVAETPFGPVAYTAPVAFQERNGIRRDVRVAYSVEGDVYGFALGDYDPTLPVVIDPLLRSTYLGGSTNQTRGGGNEGALDVDVAPNGDVIVVGITESKDFPGPDPGDPNGVGNAVLGEAAGKINNGLPDPTGLGARTPTDLFVARLNPELTTLLRATYLGGMSFESEPSLAIDPGGSIFVAGHTSSEDFPTAGGGFDTDLNDVPPNDPGLGDAFVAKLDADLVLQNFTYLGGTEAELSVDVALAPGGAVVIAGETESRAADKFPVTMGAFQDEHAGGFSDFFVASFDADLGALNQSTYLGGGQNEFDPDLDVDPSGGVWLAGNTGSTDFPDKGGAGGELQNAFGGGSDIVVAQLDGSLGLLNSSFLGGSGNEEVPEILYVEDAGSDFLLVAGATGVCPMPDPQLGCVDFPGAFPLAGTSGAQPFFGGGNFDLFVSRISPALDAIHKSTYVGGSGDEYFPSLAVYPSMGQVVVAGQTTSGDIPDTFAGMQPSPGGTPGSTRDLFLMWLEDSLESRELATYFGAFEDEDDPDVVLDPKSGDLVIAGRTGSGFGALPGIDDKSAQKDFGGFADGFVTRLPAVPEERCRAFALARWTPFNGFFPDRRQTVVDPGFAMSPISARRELMEGAPMQMSIAEARCGRNPGNEFQDMGAQTAALTPLEATLPGGSPVHTSSYAKATSSQIQRHRVTGASTFDLNQQVSIDGELALQFPVSLPPPVPPDPGPDDAWVRVLYSLTVSTAAGVRGSVDGSARLSPQFGAPILLETTGTADWSAAWTDSDSDPRVDRYARALDYSESIVRSVDIGTASELSVELKVEVESFGGALARGWLAESNFLSSAGFRLSSDTPGVTLTEVVPEPSPGMGLLACALAAALARRRLQD